MSIARVVLRRLALLIPTLLVVSVMIFGLEHIVPGGPAAGLLGSSASPARVAAENVRLGLNHPLPVLYWDWVTGALRGQLGTSYTTGEPVWTIIGQRAEPTIELILGTLVVSSILSLGIGIWSASHARSRGARTVYSLSALGFSVPAFWVAAIAVGVFALKLGLVPATGFVPLGQSLWGNIHSVILPVAVLSVTTTAILTQQVRVAMDAVLRAPYIRTERAAGIRERTILWHHGLRAGMTPLLTLVPLIVAGLVGATVLVENVMAIPGEGSEILTSVSSLDYPLLQGIVLLLALIVILLNLIVDVVNLLTDPRARRNADAAGGVARSLS
jgi:peptide/nickel transport system permease protein